MGVSKLSGHVEIDTVRPELPKLESFTSALIGTQCAIVTPKCLPWYNYGKNKGGVHYLKVLLREWSIFDYYVRNNSPIGTLNL